MAIRMRATTLAAVLAGAAWLGAGLAGAEEITLKLHHFLGPTAPAQRAFLEPWAEAVTRPPNGRIKVEIYPSMTLGGSPPQLISQLRDGVVDLIWTVTRTTPGQFPRTEVFELPFVHTNRRGRDQPRDPGLYAKWLSPE